MRTAAFIVGMLTGFGAIFVNKNKKHRTPLVQSSRPAKTAPAAAASSPVESHPRATHYPKADILLSAGPRKGPKDTELGEDVAGIALTPDRIVFWILDGTSDADTVSSDKGTELLSSRLLALTLGATFHQLAPHHQTAENLLAAAFDSVADQMQEQMVQQRPHLERFVTTQHSDLHHWEVSTTVLLGILAADGRADLLRIGDSKAVCFNEQFERLETVIADKPATHTLGRLYARLTHNFTDANVPFTFTLMPPARAEQQHLAQATGVRRIVAFSDGIGHPTEQYLRIMLGKVPYHQYQASLGRTPNRTFDDKTLVLVSFEPL